MSIRFAIYPAGRLVTYSVEGSPTAEEAGRFLDAVLAHRRFRRGFDFLGEGAAGAPPDAPFAPAIAREVQARLDLLGPCRWAVVGDRAGAALMEGQAGAVREGGIEVVSFPTRAVAADWLTESARPDQLPDT